MKSIDCRGKRTKRRAKLSQLRPGAVYLHFYSFLRCSVFPEAIRRISDRVHRNVIMNTHIDTKDELVILKSISLSSSLIQSSKEFPSIGLAGLLS